MRDLFSRFTMLSTKQRRVFRVLFYLGLFMIGNTLYLLAASHVFNIEKDPENLPVFYQLMLIIHLFLGFVLLAIVLGFAIAHFMKVRKRRRPRPGMKSTGATTVTILLLLTVTGLFILEASNSRENFWIFVSHQVLAAGVVISYYIHRLLSRIKPPLSAQVGFILFDKRKLGGTFLVIASFLVLVLAIQVKSAFGDDQEKKDTDHTTEEDYKFEPVSNSNHHTPFFPANTTTSTGGLLPSRIITHDDFPDLEAFTNETLEKGFAPSYYLGAQSCNRCHQDIVEQWSTSAHRFSSFNNPFYRASVELTRERISKKASQFCGGCHDPAVMLAGNMLEEIDPLTPESQAGLTCLACHAIDKVHGVEGNGNYNIHDATESPYIFDQVKSGIGREIHDYLLKAKPTVHKERMLKPVFKESEFCMTCHKVNLDVPVNDYRWLRGQNEYDAWHNSGVALNQPKTWYEPPSVRECQDCHMPLEKAVGGDVAAKNGMVRSHRFLSVNTALPHIRGDHETISLMEEFLRDNKLRLEIFAVRRESGELIMDAPNHDISLKAGEEIQVDVVVRNLNVGHMFPGGTNDSNEGWIDFKVESADEEVPVFHNGWVGDDRHVDPAAHFYKAVLVDRNGERIAKRNASDIYATVYANVIAPSTSDIARYKFTLPDSYEGELKISARLMWRKFNREFTEFVYEGKEIPDLPITEIETDEIRLNVSKGEVAVSSQPEPRNDTGTWIRYNDYGIGSTLDNDTNTALEAFSVVRQLIPDKMDGYLNLARVYLLSGSLVDAESMLREASLRAPEEPRLAFFWGMLLEKKGMFDEAIDAYNRTLQTYPQSRDTLVRLGRVHWLASRYKDSIESYKKVLEIDPEHALAYYQIHLAYSALASKAESESEQRKFSRLSDEYEKGFDKYKIDENAASVTRRYREENKYDNIMSQKIVIHTEG